MANQGNQFEKDVQKAVDAGSSGDQSAYNAMMQEVSKYQADPKHSGDLNKYGDAVAKGLADKGVLNEVSLRWAQDNRERFDTDKSGGLSRGEVTSSNTRVVGFDRAMMDHLRDSYDSMREKTETIFDRDQITKGDLKKLLKPYDQAHADDRQNRVNQDNAALAQQQRQDVTHTLLANDGNPKRSVFGVLDSINDSKGKKDGEISKGDLDTYLKTFADREGDFGYDRKTRDQVQLLRDQWDSDMGKQMRGTYRDNNDNEQVNRHISIDRLAQLSGAKDTDQLFAQHRNAHPEQRQAGRQGDARGKVNAVNDQYDADGNPIQPRDTVRGGVQVTENRNRQVVDADGRPVAGADRGVKDQPAANRGVKIEGRDSGGKGKDSGIPEVPPKLSEKHGQKPAEGETKQKDVPLPPKRPVELVAEPKMPELKPGDDVTKARDAYAKQVADYLTAKSSYTVQPGQGWDRIARDVLRKQGDGSHTNERNVVGLSDQISKLNGWNGRLDPNKMLHPDQVVRVRDDAWVKSQAEAALKKFDDSVKEMQKKAADTDKPPVDLYGGERNGEGVVDKAGTAKVEPKPSEAKVDPKPAETKVETKVEPKVDPKPAETKVEPKVETKAGESKVNTGNVDDPFNGTPKPDDTSKAIAPPPEEKKASTATADAQAEAKRQAELKKLQDAKVATSKRSTDQVLSPDGAVL
jgi:hypothetical protein